MTVYTYATAQDQADREGLTPTTDSRTEIAGNKFDLLLYGVQAQDSTWQYPVSPAVIAGRVHGRVVSP